MHVYMDKLSHADKRLILFQSKFTSKDSTQIQVNSQYEYICSICKTFMFNLDTLLIVKLGMYTADSEHAVRYDESHHCEIKVHLKYVQYKYICKSYI